MNLNLIIQQFSDEIGIFLACLLGSYQSYEFVITN